MNYQALDYYKHAQQGIEWAIEYLTDAKNEPRNDRRKMYLEIAITILNNIPK